MTLFNTIRNSPLFISWTREKGHKSICFPSSDTVVSSYQQEKSLNTQDSFFTFVYYFSRKLCNCVLKLLNSRKSAHEHCSDASQEASCKLSRYGRSIELFEDYKMSRVLRNATSETTRKTSNTIYHPWKLMLWYVLSITVFLPYPTFSSEAVDARWVRNWAANRLRKSWGLTNETRRRCRGNTARVTLYPFGDGGTRVVPPTVV